MTQIKSKIKLKSFLGVFLVLSFLILPALTGADNKEELRSDLNNQIYQLQEQIKQYQQKETSTKNHVLIPITEEEIVAYNPDRLILMTDTKNTVANKICQSDAIQSTSAYQKHQIFFIPEDVQMTPSQYLVLAYYDLTAALCFNEK